MNTSSKLSILDLAKWAKFFSVIIFCLFGAYILYALFVIKKLFDLAGTLNNMGIFTGFVNIIFLLLGLLCVIVFMFPNSWLHQFGKLGEKGALLNDEELMAQAFHKLKLVFKFCSITLLLAAAIIILVTCWWMTVDF